MSAPPWMSRTGTAARAMAPSGLAWVMRYPARILHIWLARELHAAQPHADLWIVPGADHVMSYFTDPGAYRKRVERFLRRLPQA